MVCNIQLCCVPKHLRCWLWCEVFISQEKKKNNSKEPNQSSNKYPPWCVALTMGERRKGMYGNSTLPKTMLKHKVYLKEKRYQVHLLLISSIVNIPYIPSSSSPLHPSLLIPLATVWSYNYYSITHLYFHLLLVGEECVWACILWYPHGSQGTALWSHFCPSALHASRDRTKVISLPSKHLCGARSPAAMMSFHILELLCFSNPKLLET